MLWRKERKERKQAGFSSGFSDDFPDQYAGKENECHQYCNKTLGEVFCRIPYHPPQIMFFLHCEYSLLFVTVGWFSRLKLSLELCFDESVCKEFSGLC